MDTSPKKNLSRENRQFAAIVLLAIACIAALWWFLNDLHRTYRTIRMHANLDSYNGQRKLVSADIQPWMTFEYLNRIFGLPSEYLKDRLAIKDQHYPRLQIQRYARFRNLNADQFTQQVRLAVEQYPSIKK